MRVDRAMLVQLLGMPEFYEACPEFSAIQADAIARYDRYLALLQGRKCAGCTARTLMLPSIREFITILVAEDTDRTRVRAFIGKCRGQQIDQCRLVCKHNGRVQEVKF